jgi:hypothetical protein
MAEPALSAVVSRPEAELLLCCARTRVRPEDMRRIDALLDGEVDWDHALRAARAHRILPLLHKHLQTHASGRIPADVAAQLEQEFRTNVGHNAFLCLELFRVLKLLARQGIPAVPFKGPVLAAAAYGELSLRMAGDLDILIEQRNVVRARDILLSAGYRRQVPFTAAREAAHLRASHQYGLVHEESGILVELQWGVTVNYMSSPLDGEGLWTRLDSIVVGGTSVPTLAVEDLLLLLCVHGTKHGWSRLAWICDVAELLRSYPGLDWEWALSQARVRGGRRMLALGLLLSHDVLDAPVPAPIAAQARSDRRAGSLAREVRTHLFRDTDDTSGSLHRPAEYRIPFNLKSRERVRDKLRCFVGLVLHLSAPRAPDQVGAPLPLYLTFLRFCLRPVRRFRTFRRLRGGTVDAGLTPAQPVPDSGVSGDESMPPSHALSAAPPDGETRVDPQRTTG